MAGARPLTRRVRRALAALAAVLLAAGAVAAPAAVAAAEEGSAAVAASGLGGLVQADVDDFSFRGLDVDYTLTRADDGTSRLRVVERFTAEFPDIDQNHGMRRSIPDSYNGQPLDPRLVSITDAEGVPREAETDSEDGVFSMTSRADGYVHGEQVYVFTYDLENVTWRFQDTAADEFYWDVNGEGWPQAFGEVTATLHLDAELASALTGAAACYAGGYGSTESCPIQTDAGAAGPATITASAGPLAAYETMTIAVGFAQGTFVLFDDGYLASPWGWLQAASFLLVIAALSWAAIVRARVLRDEPGRPTIIAEYTPPQGVDALTSAVLLGKAAKAIPAEVLEQAVVGSIRIEEGARRLFGGVRLNAVLVDPSRADRDGAQLLEGLFGAGAVPGAEFEFGSSDTRLSKTAQALLAWARKQLVARGVYRRVPAGTRAWPGLVLAAGVAGTMTGGILAIAGYVFPLVPILLVVAAVLAAIAFAALVAHRPPTAYGADLRDHLAGLREFIEWAEADRIRMLQSPQGAERVAVDTGDAAQMLKIYEPLLPYAVVFGQERKWSEQLAVYYGDRGSPSWYVGAGAFNAAAFSSGIGSLSATATASSSTSGGSGGGGSAGGGGGGGGGGGV